MAEALRAGRTKAGRSFLSFFGAADKEMGAREGEVSADVCITGGSSGLGRSLARLFAAEGYTVLVVDRKEPSTKCKFVQHNFTNPSLPVRVRCNVLILNHATFDGMERFADVEAERVEEYLRINLLSNVVLLKECRYKKVVFISSVLSLVQLPYVSLYSATKAFHSAMLLALGREGAETLVVYSFKFSTPLFSEVRDYLTMDVEAVGRRVFRGILGNEAVIYIPWIFRLSYLVHLLPLCLQNMIISLIIKVFVRGKKGRKE